MLPLQARVDLHSPKLQHYWNLTIRLFSVIYSGHSGGEGVLPLCREAVGIFYSPNRLGDFILELLNQQGNHVERLKNHFSQDIERL